MLERFEKSLAISSFLEEVKENKDFLIEGLLSSEKSALLSLIKRELKRDLLIISSNSELIYNFSAFKEDILEFPSISKDIPSIDILGKRYVVLNALMEREGKIVITSPKAAFEKIISDPTNLIYTFQKGKKIKFQSIPDLLSSLGYRREAIVSDKGEFAVRGAILDIFSPSATLPYRIEFFADEIDNIRIFNISDQRTIKKIKEATITPGSDIAKTKNSTIKDYLIDPIVIFDDILDIEDKLILLGEKTPLGPFKKEKKIFLSNHPIEKLSKVHTFEREKYFQNVQFEIFKCSITARRWFHPFLSVDDIGKLEDILIKDIPITFLSENLKKDDFFKKYSIPKRKNFSFFKGYLENDIFIGDIPLFIIPESSLSYKRPIKRRKWRSSLQTQMTEFHKLAPDDLVVHYHCGIGKYLGIESRKNHLGREDEFLLIEYQNSSKLYVPISQSYLVSKYIGAGDLAPSVDSLSDNRWQKRKRSAERRITKYAEDLLELYAKRKKEGGFQYREDSEEEKLFSDLFEYEETPDQKSAILDIKKDMQSKRPMERLLCGDVGYGKTEVAMRAAFKAASNGKQTAILVPTTVLAMQHTDTIKDRMKDFSVIVDVISRFKSKKENMKILEKVKEGKIDILIGTHRLLQKDVKFKDLGLIIVDEEQRFGVKAKEHLKKLRVGVDSLSLSATPIPRTLYLSLVNIRDMSTLQTPPEDRLPIKTVVAINDDHLIKNAILEELERGGQLFFIHNRVETIEKRASHIRSIFPKADLKFVHGQMKPEDIDDIFHSFKKGEFDILMTTTIVENGVDIPNANTIIIDDADNFGLADLYQLRGRVGRWDRPAYAYLLTRKNKKLSKIAKKRLSALLEAGGFGGGMKIATKDLEIRGAGDILGEKQSGQVTQIGFHLYCKLLKRAIDALKRSAPVNFTETRLDFSYPGYIPKSYIPENLIRRELYHRIGETVSFEELDMIEDELKDRFGTPPEEISWLLYLTKIKVLANQNRIYCLKFLDSSLQIFKTQKDYVTMLLPKKGPRELFEYVQDIFKKIF